MMKAMIRISPPQVSFRQRCEALVATADPRRRAGNAQQQP